MDVLPSSSHYDMQVAPERELIRCLEIAENLASAIKAAVASPERWPNFTSEVRESFQLQIYAAQARAQELSAKYYDNAELDRFTVQAGRKLVVTGAIVDTLTEKLF